MANNGTSVELMRGVVSVFSSVKSSTPMRTTTLKDWCLSDEFRKSVERIRNTSDEDWRVSLKKHLPCITPNGTFSRRRTDGLQTLSGYVCIDIDGKDNPELARDIEGLKQRLNASLDILYYCGLSCGGNGLYCIVPIGDEVCVSDAVAGLERVFSDLGVRIDGRCRDLPRLRCVSYDPNPIFNEGARVYVPTLPPLPPDDEVPDNPEIAGVQNRKVASTTGYDKDWTMREVRICIDKIRRSGTDITAEWADWRKVGQALANEFGEDGRSMFLSVCGNFPRYNQSECDKAFTEWLSYCDNVTIASFFYVCRKYGVTING